VLGVEVIAKTEALKDVRLFHKAWKCSKTNKINKITAVTTKFPSKYAFQPDIFQRNYEFLLETKLRVWILDKWQWQTAKRQHDAFMRSLVKASYIVQYPPPFSRLRRKFENVSLPWKTQLLFNISLTLLPKCPYEEGKITSSEKNFLFYSTQVNRFCHEMSFLQILLK
jgi:hypothetical protein